MDLDPPSPARSRAVAGGRGKMGLPQGVVANAPYVGHAPMPPAIVVPLASSEVSNDWGKPQLLKHRRQQDLQRQQQQQQPMQPVQPMRPMQQEATWVAAGEKVPAGSAFGVTPVCITMRPSMLNSAVMGLSASQLHQVTGSRPQTAQYDSGKWAYERRREAQPVLDFMYLGPSSVARDRDFLRRAGITMLLAARDSRMAAARLLSVDRTAAELGIAVDYVDVLEDRRAELIKALPGIVRTINEHMMQQSGAGGGGRVLVFCETGNERSAAVVAAYIITVYGIDLVPALQFINACRFCSNFDEDTKRMLLNYSEILQAQRDVSYSGDSGFGETLAAGASTSGAADAAGGGVSGTRHDRDSRCVATHNTSEATTLPASTAVLSGSPASRSRSRPKRRIEETLDTDDDRMEGVSDYALSRESSTEPPRLHLDMARYRDRKNFKPFTDLSGLQTSPN